MNNSVFFEKITNVILIGISLIICVGAIISFMLPEKSNGDKSSKKRIELVNPELK